MAVHMVLFSKGNHDDNLAVAKWEPLLTTDVAEAAANVYRRAIASGKYGRVLWIETENAISIRVLGCWDVHGQGVELSAVMLSGFMAGIYRTLSDLLLVHNGCKGGS